MRAIALDSINNAKQGRYWYVIRVAEIFYSLIGETVNFSTLNPKWINRDRFVLSAGHGSMETLFNLSFTWYFKSRRY
ncbi:hypothetical protein [Mycoplasmopsis cynos]|uniref:hypothetical protein n=1 Tax=Mycoplasmopsis cynos TaxID=171284 RepID=UPI002FF06FA1